jgi:hypothetical protein
MVLQPARLDNTICNLRFLNFKGGVMLVTVTWLKT